MSTVSGIFYSNQRGQCCSFTLLASLLCFLGSKAGQNGLAVVPRRALFGGRSEPYQLQTDSYGRLRAETDAPRPKAQRCPPP